MPGRLRERENSRAVAGLDAAVEQRLFPTHTSTAVRQLESVGLLQLPERCPSKRADEGGQTPVPGILLKNEHPDFTAKEEFNAANETPKAS